jgi:hypothetical protein
VNTTAVVKDLLTTDALSLYCFQSLIVRRRMCMFRLLLVAVISFVLFGNAEAQVSGTEQVTSILEQIKKKASLKFNATTVQDAIDSASYELQRMTTITLAASIDESAANAMIAEQLQTDGSFSNPRFKLAGQSVDGTIQYKGTLSIPAVGPVDVNCEMHAKLATSIQVTTDGPSADFKVAFAVSALDVKTLKVSRSGQQLPGFVNEIADGLINLVLKPAQALLNRVEFRIPTVVAVNVQLKPPQSRGLTASFNPNHLTPKLQIATLSHIIDNGRLTIVAQDNGRLNAVPSKPRNVSFELLRASFIKAITESGVAWIDQGQLSVYVDRTVFQRLLSTVFSQGPICMQANISDMPIPFATKLKLPPVESIDCTPTRDCTPTKDCAQTTDCAQRSECGTVCTFRAPITGHCVTHGHDLGCEAGKVARKAACELDKKRRHDQCEVDKAANKASCEAAKTAEKGACESLKESYKRLRATGSDFANVDSKDLLLTGGAKACLNNLAFDPKSLHLTANLVVEANATANGHIKFTPLNVAGHLTCFAPFEKSLSLNAQVPSQPVQVNTSAAFLDATTQTAIAATIANPIHIRFPFAAIAAQLGTDPGFTILCPIPGAATKLRAATPDKWWPRAARGDIERDLPDLKLDLDLLQKPLRLGKLQVVGKLRNNKTGIGGVFSLTKQTAMN